MSDGKTGSVQDVIAGINGKAKKAAPVTPPAKVKKTTETMPVEAATLNVAFPIKDGKPQLPGDMLRCEIGVWDAPQTDDDGFTSIGTARLLVGIQFDDAFYTEAWISFGVKTRGAQFEEIRLITPFSTSKKTDGKLQYNCQASFGNKERLARVVRKALLNNATRPIMELFADYNDARVTDTYNFAPKISGTQHQV